MKKVISVLLCLALLFTCVLPVSAVSHKCDCSTAPVVHVYGFGSAISYDDENGTQKDVFSLEVISGMLPPALDALTELLLKNDAKGFEKKIVEVVDALFGSLKTDNNLQHKTAVYPTVITDPTVDKHQDTHYVLMTNDLAQEGNEYGFRYDWSRDPVAIADDLNAYIEQVKATTGHDKVIISAHSMGNAVTCAYLYQYGYDSVEKIVDLCGAFQGISVVGKLFSGELDLAGNADALYDFLLTFLGTDGITGVLNAYVNRLNERGILDKVVNALAKTLNECKDEICDDLIRNFFGKMPSIWCFVPDEYYEQAKAFVFNNGTAGQEKLIATIDNYHYNVQNNAVSLLKKATEKNISVSVVSGYAINPIPASQDCSYQTDFLIDTKYTSLGATTAKIGETFPKTDSPYLSPDLSVDASTCAFPDSTWFLKYQDHNDFCDAFMQLATWLITFDGQPTIYDNEAFPQFLICQNHEYFVPVTADNNIADVDMSLFAVIKRWIISVFEMFKKMFILR